MSDEVYECWKGIAGAINRSKKTAQAWARTRGLPVRVRGGTVYMSRADYEAWLKRADRPFLEHMKDRESPEFAAAPSKAA